jgi:hypothetical protein
MPEGTGGHGEAIYRAAASFLDEALALIEERCPGDDEPSRHWSRLVGHLHELPEGQHSVADLPVPGVLTRSACVPVTGTAVWGRWASVYAAINAIHA